MHNPSYMSYNENVAHALKKFVEAEDQSPVLPPLLEVMSNVDADTLAQVVMALSSNFVRSNDADGQLRVDAVVGVIPDDQLAALTQQYIQQSTGFLDYYRHAGLPGEPVQEETQVEQSFDQVARTFEETLARVDSYTLMLMITSLGHNFGNASSPEGQSRLNDALRYFSDFDEVDFEPAEPLLL